MKLRLRNKLRACGGFTLVEMLSTLAIVVLITMLVAVGVSLATRTYSQSIELSEAKVLHSTLSEVISNELAQTGTIEAAGASADGKGYKLGKFFSRNYGVKDDLCAFQVLDPETGKVMASGGKGQLALGSGTVQNRLLSSAAYTNGTTATIGVNYYEAKETPAVPAHFEVTLNVYSKDGNELVSNTFDVVPYNHVTVK